MVVFSGRPDPQWRVDLSAFNDSDYHSIQNVGVDSSCIPAKLGYKGFLVQDAARELLIVGSESATGSAPDHAKWYITKPLTREGLE